MLKREKKFILKREQRKPGANIISWPKPGPIPNMETACAVSPTCTCFALNYCPKKKKVQTKLQELGILDGIMVYGAQLKIRFST